MKKKKKNFKKINFTISFIALKLYSLMSKNLFKINVLKRNEVKKKKKTELYSTYLHNFALSFIHKQKTFFFLNKRILIIEYINKIMIQLTPVNMRKLI